VGGGGTVRRAWSRRKREAGGRGEMGRMMYLVPHAILGELGDGAGGVVGVRPVRLLAVVD